MLLFAYVCLGAFGAVENVGSGTETFIKTRSGRTEDGGVYAKLQCFTVYAQLKTFHLSHLRTVTIG